MSVAIAARDVEKVYGFGPTEVRAVRGVTFDVIAGEILVLMGPSGSGKTTLLSILSGILTPTSGTVKVLGKEITLLDRRALAEFRRPNFGFVFQGFNLFRALSARENVELALNLKGITGSAARVEADKLLESACIAHGSTRKPADLSGGEKQRVSIARALAGDPALVMADEPTASLDWENGKAAVALLRELGKEKGTTVLIVTHDQRVAELADRVMHLQDGMIDA
jgi:putative ABC transport system ATP-binding protein